MMMVLYALMGIWVSSAKGAVIVPNAFAVVAACSMAAVVREGTGMWDAELHDDDSIALEKTLYTTRY